MRYHNVLQMTPEAWEALGTRLHGADKKRWRFRCPACGHCISYAEYLEKYPDKTRLDPTGKQGWDPATECLGIHIEGVGCTHVAYGRFPGPVEILGSIGMKYAFFFAPPKVDTPAEPC